MIFIPTYSVKDTVVIKQCRGRARDKGIAEYVRAATKQEDLNYGLRLGMT